MGRCRAAVALLILAGCGASMTYDKDSSWKDLQTHTTKLRHSRHSNSKEDIIIKGNHKPVFVDCASYNVSLDEEMEPGQFIIKVTAVDNDPPEMGGTVTYAFVAAQGEKPKFSIDPVNGRIKSEHKFDRDEPIREKEAYITVRATDNGNPELDDVCTIKVTILDINDNMPVFDKVVYSESIPQDLQVGSLAMKISATDIDDGKNSVVEYELDESSRDFDYFTLDKSSGALHLKKPIDKRPGYQFSLRANARDQGMPPRSNTMPLEIVVVESNKKTPEFTLFPNEPIYLKENISDFKSHIATLEAVSRIPNEDELIFELVIGQTEQSNKRNTFVMESENNKAFIKLGNHLDYEKITDYTLVVRVQNKYNLAAEKTVFIKVEDVNDNIPQFNDVVSGSVPENEPPGTPVMQVKAIDRDGTSANNIVSYQLADHKDMFEIDSVTGNITTLVEFDREQKDFYNVKVIATDNSQSALTFKKHNIGERVFRIEIADVNDNKPHFSKDTYVAFGVSEGANANAKIIDVAAEDKDTASELTYSIIEGNTDDAFYIESKTGTIKVKDQLDYEKTKEYTLSVKAFDGIYSDFAKVIINVDNINDNQPVFMNNDNVTIDEESLVEGCITKVEAYDPDIEDRTADQKIAYTLVREEFKQYMSIDNDGCLRLNKPLDRDPPYGYATWQVLILARDEGGSPTGLTATKEVFITLRDINDNPPFLSNPQPVHWRENRDPGQIVVLKANDNDSPENGAPFKFALDGSASNDIRSKFEIRDDALFAKVVFDREEIKEYFLPIAITDSGRPPLTGVSKLWLIIADVNDNPMKSGHNDISVFNYKGEFEDTEIGRVYVTDPDDWDLPDKNFYWSLYDDQSRHFSLSRDTGMLTMSPRTPEGVYNLFFNVTEQNLPLIPFHSVDASVNVTIKIIPEEAVTHSGSIRFINTTAEQFIEIQHAGLSKKDILRQQISIIMNTSLENVDIFTVYNEKPENDNYLDVRFSAHGSPYYASEKINSRVTDASEELESLLGMKIQMIGIDKCIFEKFHCLDDSCKNTLVTQKHALSVFTNTTSLIGVDARLEPECSCAAIEQLTCLNGGTPFLNRCECPVGLTGPRCEITSVGFHGDGWALYPSFSACNETEVTLSFSTTSETGLIFYIGPLKKNNLLNVQDFMALQIIDGRLTLFVNYGSGTSKVEHRHSTVAVGETHHVRIILVKTGIEMIVDNCKLSSCMNLAAPNGPNEFLNVNGPLQIGGANINLHNLGKEFGWNHIPLNVGFSGCISNFTFNSEMYNLGDPSDSLNLDTTCSTSTAKAVSFGIDTNFLVALLVCITILLLLLLTVVVLRRRQVGMSEKEFDDIRENIINYEDEGGGEGDAAYDLQVLRQNCDMNEKQRDLHQTYAPSMTDRMMHPDISGFLDEKKHNLDRDPLSTPFDDVRHYAYEGDGNSSGSLSSLASCTDEGDLKFNYLSSFGPRFRKLADMYGEVPSDEEESQAPGEESWC